MTDIFDGDPLIIQTSDGAEMVFNGGQPVMDTGVENQANFSMLTKAGHWSEDLEPDVNRRYTGLLLESLKKPITSFEKFPKKK